MNTRQEGNDMSRAGRTLDQLRKVKFTRDFISAADASVLVEFGKTRVICTASLEDRVPPFRRGSGAGWVTAEYGMLPRSTQSRMDREAAKGKQSGRTQEIQRLIGRSLRSVTDLSKLGERTIKIDCDVIEADGGTRTASITGGFIVLYETVMNLVASGAILEMPINKFVAAISVGIVSEKVFLDLDYVEDSGCETDLNLVMSEDQKFIEIQGTAEGAPFDRLQLDEMLAYGQKGILELISMQKRCLGVNV